MGDLFDASAMDDADYLYFFAAPRGLGEFAVHGPVVPGVDLPGEAAAELAWQPPDLRAGMSALDLACGHGELAANRAVLDGIVRVLRPGGRLAMDLDDLTMFLASYCPSRVMAAREIGDMLVDRYHLDAQTGRFEAERTDIRNGRARRMNFVKRLFGFPELRGWLLAAGFTSVAGYGEDARPLTADHRRMIIIADLP